MAQDTRVTIPAPLSVATSQIANDAVTDAKLRNSAALSLIGRSANSSGDPADIAGTDGKTPIISGGATPTISWAFGAQQVAAVTTGTTTSDATTGTSTGVAWNNLAAGGTYSLESWGLFTAAAATTGIQFALIRSNGCTLTVCEQSVMCGAGSTSTWEETTNTSITDGFSAGTGSGGATARTFRINGLLIINAAGTLTLQVRTEVAASAVTISRGYAVLRRIA